MIGVAPLILIALVALSVLVLVHEFGHYVAARLSGVWVEEFGIGLPPKLWGKKIGKTLYSVNALPIGGFVRLHGESAESKISKPKEAFVNKSKGARAFIALAGVFMNFVFATIAFAIITAFVGIPKGVTIAEVTPDSPASAGKLAPDDRILSIGGKEITYTDQFSKTVAQFKGQEVEFVVSRSVNGVQGDIHLPVVIRSQAPEGEGLLGVLFTPSEIYFPPVWKRPFVYLAQGYIKTVDISTQIVNGFALMLTQALGGTAPKGLAGPVAVTAIIAEVAKIGILPLLEFMAIISINLAILNLVPFPPLDGARVFFILIETVTRKKMVPRIENMIHSLGMALLLLLMLALTAHEIPGLLKAGSLAKFVQTIIQ